MDSNLVGKERDSPINLNEFMWAFTIVSSRSLVFNNRVMPDTTDPNAFITIMPLIDFVNHSLEPNCMAIPYHDKVNDESFVILKAIKDIKPNEQVTINYGDLPNTHLIQKYGFVQPDNPQKKILCSFPFREYDSVVYEEASLKSELSKKLKIPMKKNGLENAEFLNNRFPKEVLKRLRLSFLSSQTLLDNGGKAYIDSKDFSEPLDLRNESMVFDFLINRFEGHLN